ncbi:hypothetical protein ACK8P5_25700 (plasmid) [Paenibacillus sp. EC2-1]|uniref:hypothetical protein n=1 Tax=Paenibacillus sp. EC2-1 TaxID=3388665 RepID=UPI003BEED45C
MIYDFLYNKPESAALGKCIYILGTSIDGPLFEPVQIKGPDQAIKVFGDRDSGTLVRAFEQAYELRQDISIFLMRITGKSATLKIEGLDVPMFGDFLTLRAINAGEKYNSINIRVEYRPTIDEFSFIIKHLDDIIVYNLLNYGTMDELIQAINNDCRSGLHTLLATTELGGKSPIDLFTAIEPDGVNLSGGEDGVIVSKDDLYIAADTAYNLLLGKAIDIIVPVGMYVDDVHPAALYGNATYGSAYYASNRDYLRLVDTENENKVVSFHEQLIEFCRAQFSLGMMTHGIIGIRPLDVIPDNVEYDSSYILRLVEATAFRDRHGFVDFKNGQYSDKGYFITVFASEFVFQQDTETEYFDSGAVVYGALMAGRFETTTNTKLPESIRLRYELSNDSLRDLSKLGVTGCKVSVRHGLVVYSGVTAAHWANDLHNVSNVRMIQSALSAVNEVIERVTEEDYEPSIRRRILDDEIKDRMKILSDAEIVTGYDYQVLLDNSNSQGAIVLKLKTKYSVEAIGTSAQISYSGGARYE